MGRRIVALAALVVVACAPTRVRERPILDNGDRVPPADGAVAAARIEAQRDAAQSAALRDSLAAQALATCAPDICSAVARGEVALGMTETQVLAATRTTQGAWSVRDAGGSTVMVPRTRDAAPSDAVGQLAMLQLRDGRLSTYSYQEAQGVRVVSRPEDATTIGRSAALAEMLIREGDDYAARGQLDQALDRYDRAHVLNPDPLVDYRIATVLDKQLRPIEALIRYQLFLHRLEIEKIQAIGEAYGNLASAIAHARERVIVLERHGR
jgi:tetratricopeptide (TPR) repeat protein